MFALILILILFLPVALLPFILEGPVSANELTEMGIRLETPQAEDLVQTI